MFMTILRYAIKHAIAACTIVCSSVALTVITYFGLLIWAILSNSPIGSPVALPFWAFVALALSIVAVLAVFWPVTSISEVICRKLGNWNPLANIATASLLLFIEVVLLGIIYAIIWKQPVMPSMMDGAIAGLILLVPLGIYWCMLQATDWIIVKSGLLLGCLFKRSNNNEDSAKAS